jgi:hypothetical protein
LSVIEDPQAKTDLFDGKINIFECHSCGLKVLIPVPFLYDDAARELCVQFFPFQMVDNQEFYGGFAQNGMAAAEIDDPAAPEYVRSRHTVFEMGELLRYVIFRERLWGLYHPEQTTEAESRGDGQEQTPEGEGDAEVAEAAADAEPVSEPATPGGEAPGAAEGEEGRID